MLRIRIIPKLKDVETEIRKQGFEGEVILKRGEILADTKSAEDKTKVDTAIAKFNLTSVEE